MCAMSNFPRHRYPPQVSQAQLLNLINDVKDWQLNNGSLLKLVKTEEEHTILARPVGVAVFPTLFPKECFDEALYIQTIFNELYASLTCNEAWLSETMKDLIRTDRFTSILWDIHLEVKQEGYAQDLTLGVFRSDYMLQRGHNLPDGIRESSVSLKQIEFNAFFCAGSIHGNRVTSMHQHLTNTGIYETKADPDYPVSPGALPPCNTMEGLVTGLAAAHRAYGAPSTSAEGTAILMVVQPHNFNVCDERPIEYSLWSQDPPIPTYRVIFGSEVLSRTFLTSSRALLFTPPGRHQVEISVVYMRAGIDEYEYDETGIAARTKLEKSCAIKCPSVLSHLTTFKKVQQALAAPYAVLRFLSSAKASRISPTFAPIYPLDESEFGLQARNLACDPKTAVDYVLKPSLEGGGNNVYGADIPGYLSAVSKDLWANYVLMKNVTSPDLNNTLISPRELYSGPVVSELGVWGVCLWRQNDSEEVRQSTLEMPLNKVAGFSMRTKARHINEMSVVKGYGCFDSPYLVDIEVFEYLTHFSTVGKTFGPSRNDDTRMT